MEVYDVDILGIFLKCFGAVIVFFCVTASICHYLRRGCFHKKGHNDNNYNWPAQRDGVDYGDADEGHFRHKSSFII
ncbi:Junctional adhesion molecule C [Solea senegalensis]|nr:junctional adhesion molecule 3B-like [Solea senegalensis]KAG7480342.1 Junctional adhesion molecule C [Solea senegalensis]